MKLINYLKEISIQPTKIKVEGKKLVVPEDDRGKTAYLEISDKPKVVMLKDKAGRATKTTMVYKDESNIMSYDSKNRKESFKSLDALAKYLNDEDFVYFEGYNLFTAI